MANQWERHSWRRTMRVVGVEEKQVLLQKRDKKGRWKKRWKKSRMRTMDVENDADPEGVMVRVVQTRPVNRVAV